MADLKLIDNDPWLKDFEDVILKRNTKVSERLQKLGGLTGLRDFANGHHYFGLHKKEDCWILREWAPNATSIQLIGDRMGWENTDQQYRFKELKDQVWELQIPLTKLKHLDQYKLEVTWEGGSGSRLPVWGTRMIQNPENLLFNAQVWDPEEQFSWKNPTPQIAPGAPILVYEAHVGMSSEDPKVSTYKEFTINVLPRVAALGYNLIQLMAIQEHPYYGSFGYHVSNLFSPTSRFGNPDELKELIDAAHGLGLLVVMDIVHSHVVKNILEGPGLFDGKPGMFFHTDHRREHPAWDSLCFDYGKDETLHFLLSNCKYWLTEFRFDGFRFDGVTSMMYYDHGLEKSFSSYSDYFNQSCDEDAISFLTLANVLIHEINPQAISIAEDMSGMPGLAAPYNSGGMGFDFRLAMGIPDFWIKMIKEKQDEAWNINEIFYELTNRRADEKVLSYTESHDQALVGDKTLIFRLADKEMYTSMARNTDNLIVDRAIALHKMIRLITLSTSGGGYLNFMGNEFGHPEWIDFPREGNNWSYHYARRQWSLVDNQNLKYQFLNEFDKKLIGLFNNNQTICTESPEKVFDNPGDQILAFRRADYLFIMNWNPSRSFTDYGIPCEPADYKIILHTDHKDFGGFERLDDRLNYEATSFGLPATSYQIKVYLPSRTAVIMKKIPAPKIRK